MSGGRSFCATRASNRPSARGRPWAVGLAQEGDLVELPLGLRGTDERDVVGAGELPSDLVRANRRARHRASDRSDKVNRDPHSRLAIRPTLARDVVEIVLLQIESLLTVSSVLGDRLEPSRRSQPEPGGPPLRLPTG